MKDVLDVQNCVPIIVIDCAKLSVSYIVDDLMYTHLILVKLIGHM